MDKYFYPDFSSNWDDYLFRSRILKYLTKNSVILDVGAGAGIVEAMNFKGQVKRICGVDLDPRIVKNEKLDEGVIANADNIPYEDNTFDVVFADNVMEHLFDPEPVFLEIQRVLKPEGLLLFKTPNRSHYMPFIARLTPHRFHQFVNKIRGRNIEDTFSTYYKANSFRQVCQLAKKTGFVSEKIDRIEGRPEYLRMTMITYLFGVIYERIVNSSEVFSRWRILLIAELRKKS